MQLWQSIFPHSLQRPLLCPWERDTFTRAAISGHSVAGVTSHAGVGALGVEAESRGTGSLGSAFVNVCISTQGRAGSVGRMWRNHDQGQMC